MCGLKFRRACGGTVALSDRVISTFSAYAQLGESDPESGGILLGRLILESDDVVIDVATQPAPEDRSWRFYFWRSNKPALRRVTEAWYASGGTQVYLGDWHTHPEDVPSPSCVDLRNWKRLLRKSKYEQGFLLFVIVGRKETSVWEGAKAGGISRLAAVQAAIDKGSWDLKSSS